jgi:hypothetical protein
MSMPTDAARDPFVFSRGGLQARSSHVHMPAIAHERINRAWDEKLRHNSETRSGRDRHGRRRGRLTFKRALKRYLARRRRTAA